jgi:drug/metabolite transporter (DMT)-like permease
VVSAVVVVGVVCTAIAFVVFFHLIAETGPVRATVITYVNPAVAIALGVAFLHERIGAGTAIGFVLVLAGSFLATRRRRPPQHADRPIRYLWLCSPMTRRPSPVSRVTSEES